MSYWIYCTEIYVHKVELEYFSHNKHTTDLEQRIKNNFVACFTLKLYVLGFQPQTGQDFPADNFLENYLLVLSYLSPYPLSFLCRGEVFAVLLLLNEPFFKASQF